MSATARAEERQAGEPARLEKDPVCGMTVDAATAGHRREHDGRTFYFCSAGCARKFETAPNDYARGERPQPKEAPADAIYTCPMHPEIEQVGPGDCPICGMALEPETVTAGGGAEPGMPRHEPAVLDRRGAGLPLLVW